MAGGAVSERKLVTVLFADLVDSTALADNDDPERVRARLDRFYEAMADEIVRAGGTVEKFAGDAVMAVFGAPVAHEDDAERALHAALAMRHRLRQLFGDDLSLRIGVNTGEVAVGEARAGSSFVSGDAVNVAARLEQGAARGEILAGERTAASVRGAFELDEPRAIRAKGKAGQLRARPVLRALTLMRPRGVGGLAEAFVGRDTEIELLRATYKRAVGAGEPHLVTIMGDAGVGKTRLVRELWSALGGESPEPLRRTGRCLPYGRGITYWPLGEILREHFGLLETDGPSESLARLGDREDLGIALGLDVSGEAHPLTTRERLHAASVDLFAELAASRPTVALVEDLHWAEDDLLDLLERIHLEAVGPLLLIGTARPELLDRRPRWGGGRRNSATVWLEPLSLAETSTLLDRLLGGALPEGTSELLAERAEGNPFFVEEIVRTLIDAGTLRRDRERWTMRESDLTTGIPDSVQAVLASRIDLLPATEKEALQAAAVIGRVFWRRPLVHLLGGTEPDLALLEERDFVRRRAGSSLAREEEYAIKHALTREVAYASLAKARRAKLHAALADWLERDAGAADEHAPLLAHHYAEAARPEDADLAWPDDPAELGRLRGRARTWLGRAAELAQKRYEIADVVELLTRALELTDDERERALLWRRIGVAHALRFDGEAFWTAMLQALEGGLTEAEQADVYSTLAFQTALRSGMWVDRPAPELVDGWVDRALSLSAPRSVARARALVTRVDWRPDPHVGLEAAREALEIAEQLGDVELESYALGGLSAVEYEGYRFLDAAALIDRRQALVPRIGDLDHLTEIYETVVPVMVAVGRFDDARAAALEHGRLSKTLSPHHRLHSVSLEIELAEGLGRWDAIVGASGALADAMAENRATYCMRHGRGLLLCAVAHAAVGARDRADELEREGAAASGEGHEFLFVGPRIRLALLRGDVRGAHRLAQQPLRRTWVYGPATMAAKLDALAAARDARQIESLAETLVLERSYVEPFALRALGIVRDDEEFLRRADERFAELGLDWYAAQGAAIAGR